VRSYPAGGGEKVVKNQAFFRLRLKTVGTSSFFPRIGRKKILSTDLAHNPFFKGVSYIKFIF
jgi:hypothetical protein